MKAYKGEVTLNSDLVKMTNEFFYECSECGMEMAPADRYDDKLCITCYEDRGSEDMEHWLRADYNSRCTL